MKLEWDFRDFCESDDKFLEELEDLRHEIDALEQDISPLSLEKYYECKLIHERLNAYAELNSDVDLSNVQYQDFKRKIVKSSVRLESILTKVNECILKENLSLEDFLEKYPLLKPYQMHIYEVLRFKEHICSDDVVNVCLKNIQEYNTLYNLIMSVEMTYQTLLIDDQEVKINYQKFSKLLKDPDRELREQAFYAFVESIKRVNRSVSSLLNLRMNACYEVAKRKNYTSVLEQELVENDLNDKLLTNLVSSVHDNLPLLQRYYHLKKQDLNLDSLAFWDTNVQRNYSISKKFEDALDDVKESLGILGNEYLEDLQQVLERGCLDVFPKENKFSGGYHFRNYTKPMILMNYSKSFSGVRTLAHELGHAVNGLKIKRNQPYQNFHFSLFLSETASKTNEFLLENYYIKNAKSKEEKVFLLEEQLNNFVASVFGQTMYYEFSKKLYERIENNENLTTLFINDTFEALLKQYYPDLVGHEDMKYMWQTRVHHFYGDFKYYNYQYATGFLASLKISNDIIKGKEKAKENYLQFLTIGGSMPTLESLKVAGVSFEDDVLFQEGMEYFANLLDEYEKVLMEN